MTPTELCDFLNCLRNARNRRQIPFKPTFVIPTIICARRCVRNCPGRPKATVGNSWLPVEAGSRHGPTAAGRRNDGTAGQGRGTGSWSVRSAGRLPGRRRVREGGNRLRTRPRVCRSETEEDRRTIELSVEQRRTALAASC